MGRYRILIKDMVSGLSKYGTGATIKEPTDDIKGLTDECAPRGLFNYLYCDAMKKVLDH